MLVSLKPYMLLRLMTDIDLQWRHDQKYLHTFPDKAIQNTINFTNEKHIFFDTVSRIEGASWLTNRHSSVSAPNCCKDS